MAGLTRHLPFIMLDIINIIYQGIFIGILVSAPMGPIGLLCIQRTLNKGQWHGFFSGVGAALSDLLYACMVCFGMGLVVDFMEKYQNILQIVGSIFLLIFGIYIFRSNPSKQLHKPKEQINSISQDIISAFFLTLSNPLIICVYIVGFSRFNFISSEETLFSILLGLLSILIGALSWWFLITFLVGKLRKVFNLRGLWLLNRIVGTVIIVLSVWGLVYRQGHIYNYNADNAIEILQKEKIRYSFYNAYFCGADTLPRDTDIQISKVKEYDNNGQCIKESGNYYNRYTICQYENNKPLLKVDYLYSTMERRDSTVYSYTEDIESITRFDENNFITLMSKNRFDKFDRNIECIDYNSNGKEICRVTCKYDRFGLKERIIYEYGHTSTDKRTSIKNRKIIHERYNEGGIYQGGVEYTFDDKNRLIHLFAKMTNAYYQESWSYNDIGLIDRHVTYKNLNKEWIPFLVGYYTYEKWE